MTASAAATPIRSSAMSKMPRSGFETPTSSDAINTSTYAARPQYAQLVALLLEEIVGDDADARVRAQREQQIGGAVERAPRDHVAGAVRRRGRVDVGVVQRDPERREHAPEPLAARVVEPDAAGQHLEVHDLERHRVLALEGVDARAVFAEIEES